MVLHYARFQFVLRRPRAAEPGAGARHHMSVFCLTQPHLERVEASDRTVAANHPAIVQPVPVHAIAARHRVLAERCLADGAARLEASRIQHPFDDVGRQIGVAPAASRSVVERTRLREGIGDLTGGSACLEIIA